MAMLGFPGCAGFSLAAVWQATLVAVRASHCLASLLMEHRPRVLGAAVGCSRRANKVPPALEHRISGCGAQVVVLQHG